jgi:hypothetical protein
MFDGQDWSSGFGAGQASPSERGRDGGSTTPSPPQPELVLAMVVPRASCQQLWAATRGASKRLWNDAGPPPFSFTLKLASALASGLRGQIEISDLGPVPLRCRHCQKLRANTNCQRMLRFWRPYCVLAPLRQKVYIGADCCAPLIAASLWKDIREGLWKDKREGLWKDIRVSTDIGSDDAYVDPMQLDWWDRRLWARQPAPTSQHQRTAQAMAPGLNSA